MLTNVQDELREQLAKVLMQYVHNDLSNLETAEVLISLAVGVMDCRRGEDDTLHVMKQCHKLVNERGNELLMARS